MSADRRNHFPLTPSERYLFIAGGVGITPLLPMVHQAELLGAEWQLLYGGRTRASMAFYKELTAAHGERVHIAPQDEAGLLDLASWLGTPRPDTKVYCCGPAPLLAAVEAACAHWPPYTLRTERFTAAEQSAPVRDLPFDVELRRTGRTVTVTPDVPSTSNSPRTRTDTSTTPCAPGRPCPSASIRGAESRIRAFGWQEPSGQVGP
ncbi:ferredoxin reductase [Streptomyces sp. NPDC051001]|uniref:ferredoxin reductase n=1 Tax=Streptomyces sp. NPDC051001 TaxID=3155795 RepID=UPI003416785E